MNGKTREKKIDIVFTMCNVCSFPNQCIVHNERCKLTI